MCRLTSTVLSLFKIPVLKCVTPTENLMYIPSTYWRLKGFRIKSLVFGLCIQARHSMLGILRFIVNSFCSNAGKKILIPKGPLADTQLLSVVLGARLYKGNLVVWHVKTRILQHRQKNQGRTELAGTPLYNYFYPLNVPKHKLTTRHITSNYSSYAEKLDRNGVANGFCG